MCIGLHSPRSSDPPESESKPCITSTPCKPSIGIHFWLLRCSRREKLKHEILNLNVQLGVLAFAGWEEGVEHNPLLFWVSVIASIYRKVNGPEAGQNLVLWLVKGFCSPLQKPPTLHPKPIEDPETPIALK